jgi:hypothetical protein
MQVKNAGVLSNISTVNDSLRRVLDLILIITPIQLQTRSVTVLASSLHSAKRFSHQVNVPFINWTGY